MNPTTIDPDLAPLHAADVLPNPPLNPIPDLTKPEVLLPLLRVSAEGMRMESDAANPHSHQTGHSNPSFLFMEVATQLKAAIIVIESLQTKIEELLTRPATPAPVPEPAPEPHRESGSTKSGKK